MNLPFTNEQLYPRKGGYLCYMDIGDDVSLTQFQIASIPSKPVTHRVGNVYKHNDKYYLLSQVDCHTVCLITLDCVANRWRAGCFVKDVANITEMEFKAISDDSFSGIPFVYVGVFEGVHVFDV